ncbi:ornithine decarboxylase [Trichomonascus vanleenenianus]|uniref:ornithine decarboxylase SPE1 n=1 Tax=Trichomonascus vanleenenianus TaxID=2268995 RepID=UPI003ECA2D8E
METSLVEATTAIVQSDHNYFDDNDCPTLCPVSSRQSTISDASDDSLTSELTLYDLSGNAATTMKYTVLDSVSGETLSKKLVGEALRERIESIDLDTCHYGGEDSFFVADLGVVYRQYQRWLKNLPRVEPFYAVKCNQDYHVVRLLARLGAGFDCASKNEISFVLNLGVNPSKIIYANPCKGVSYIRYAQQEGIKMMTFDNADELRKCKRFYPDADLLLRIMTDDSTAQCRLSVKFGAPMSDTKDLLKLAKDLELNVVGVAFHVGSGASDFTTFYDSVKNAKAIFDEAEELGMPPMTVLDCGGGFESSTFEQSAAVLRDSLDEFFPAESSSNLRIIAEPGRYFVASAFTVAAHVIGRRWINETVGDGMLYINDGVYGNLNCILFDHQKPTPRALMFDGRNHGMDRHFLHGLDEENCTGKYKMSIWGPTCDGLDCVTESCTVPYPLDVGDWVYFSEMGAYTLCASTGFNGFNSNCNVIYVCSEPHVARLLEV